MSTPLNSPKKRKPISNLMVLRKSDTAHFRKEFAALGEQQGRFMEYKEMKELKAQKRAASKKEAPMLTGFYLSQQQDQPNVQPVSNKTKNKKRRRCTLL